MKAIIIADNDKVIDNVRQVLKSRSYDTIVYRWLLKALDNLEEISPHLIVVSQCDYPRHWKTITQFAKSGIAGFFPQVILYTRPDFSDEEKKKAEALGVRGTFSSVDVEGLDELREILEKKNDIFSGDEVEIEDHTPAAIEREELPKIDEGEDEEAVPTVDDIMAANEGFEFEEPLPGVEDIMNASIKTEPENEEVSEEVVEEEIIEEPVIEESVIEEPIIEDEPEIVETPVEEKIIIEEPAIEEEPEIDDQIVIEEPTIEDTPIEEESAFEPIVEEPLIEDTAVEETPVEEEITIEEPAIEEESEVVEETPPAEPATFEKPEYDESLVIETPLGTIDYNTVFDDDEPIPEMPASEMPAEPEAEIENPSEKPEYDESLVIDTPLGQIDYNTVFDDDDFEFIAAKTSDNAEDLGDGYEHVSFMFTNPKNGVLVTGITSQFNGSSMEFLPDFGDFIATLSLGDELPLCSIKRGKEAKNVSAQVTDKTADGLMLFIREN